MLIPDLNVEEDRQVFVQERRIMIEHHPRRIMVEHNPHLSYGPRAT